MDEKSRIDIDKRIEKILRDMGVKEPPLILEDVLSFLDVFRGYYSLSDPGFIDHISYKLRIGARQLTSFIEKVKLKALWLPDEKKILIDKDTPSIKHRWYSAHELGHRIVPWHSDFTIGDTAETLDPDYHEIIEAEANYAAASLLFLASRFSREASDYELNIKSVQSLSKIYNNSQAMTLRRFVQYGRDKPMVAIISKPHWLAKADESLCRYFIPSKMFQERFGKVKENDLLEAISNYIIRQSGGPVGGGEFILIDDNGFAHEFIGDSFYNRYDILTLVVHKRESPRGNF